MAQPVTVLSTGGTIALSRTGRAVTALTGAELVAAVPSLVEIEDLRVETVCELASSHLETQDALHIAQAAVRQAGLGRGVVVTHGTDTLEETAYLTDVMYGGGSPIVFTGASRPASAPGADGPANLVDAVAVASSDDARGYGVLVAFAGDVHAARYVRKVDSAAVAPFESPARGPVGRITEGRIDLGAIPIRLAPVVPEHLNARVPIVPTWLGDDGTMISAAADGCADGLVIQTLGAGRLGPPALDALRAASANIPVVATTRPERGAVLRETGIRDVAVAAGRLSSAAARMKLLACLGAGLRRAEIAEAFRHDDA